MLVGVGVEGAEVGTKGEEEGVEVFPGEGVRVAEGVEPPEMEKVELAVSVGNPEDGKVGVNVNVRVELRGG